jgi:arylsulfatase A-like enzyme
MQVNPKQKLPQSRQHHPNVLLIVMDDQRADLLLDSGPHGFPAPNLKQLADRGAVFDNTFVTTPICTPARAELLTGCHTFHNGVPWFRRPINENLPLLPRHFQENGYRTLFAGKWHNDGHPDERGFDCSRRVFPEDNLNQPEYDKFGHTMRFMEAEGPVEGHSTTLFTDAALEEIESTADDKPWFCYLGYHSPHDPFDCPLPWAAQFPADEVPLPPDYFPMPPYDNGDLTIRDELLLPWPRTQEAIREYRARYWRMVAHHDAAIGSLLDNLERLGKLENTLVVFTSDHGLAVGSHGLLGKENMYDHSCRIPLIMSGPGIPAGLRIQGLTTNQDLFPTLCDLCHIPQPAAKLDGRSLIPALSSKQAFAGREFVVCAFGSPHPHDPQTWHETQRAIRTQDWKLVVDLIHQRHQLYDLKADPCEMKNLLEPWLMKQDLRWSYQPEYPQPELQATVACLWQKLLDWQTNNQDPAFSILQTLKLPTND